MLINKRLEEPYNKRPEEGPLPILSKTFIKSKLSPHFWAKTKYIYESNNSLPLENNINETINIHTKHKKNTSNNNIKLKNKRGKTPTMKHTKLKHINSNNKNKYFNFDDNLDNINNKNQLEELREIAIKLEEELNKNLQIIEQQKEENFQLSNKIDNLTLILKSAISTDQL